MWHPTGIFESIGCPNGSKNHRGGRDCEAIGVGNAYKRLQLPRSLFSGTDKFLIVEIAASCAYGTPIASQSRPPVVFLHRNPAIYWSLLFWICNESGFRSNQYLPENGIICHKPVQMCENSDCI